MTLGSRIREYRIKRGLTQSQIADQLNMTESNFSSYERDKSFPPSEKLSLIATALDVSTDYLLLGRVAESSYQQRLGRLHRTEEGSDLSDTPFEGMGKRIESLREKGKITREQLAEMIGVPVLEIESYEKGLVRPENDIIKKISEALFATPNYILGRTGIDGKPRIGSYDELLGSDPNFVDDRRTPRELVIKDDRLFDLFREIQKRESLRLLFDKVKEFDDETLKKLIRVIDAMV